MVRTLADDDLDDGDRKLLADIDRVGWHVVMVPEEGGNPGWSFSVGLLTTFHHPEVVVFGLPLELLGQVINVIGAAVEGGGAFEAGREYPGVLEGMSCTFRPVVRRWYRPFLGYASWYHRGPEFPALQCIWPDKRKRYPWQPEFEPAWVGAQPLLFEAEPEAARVVKLLESMGGE